MTVFDLAYMPSGGCELLLPLLSSEAGDHPVQGLTIEVDDPQHISQTLRRRIRNCLPNVSLIKFSVTDQRNESRSRSIAEVRVNIAARNSREEGGGGAQTN